MEVLQVSREARQPAVRFLTLGLALGAMGLSGCDDPCKAPPKFRLEGSLSQVMDLGYDEARVLLAPEDVSLLFVRTHCQTAVSSDGGVPDPGTMVGMVEDYPLKVGYRLLGDVIGGRYDLSAQDDAGAQRGSLSRNVRNDPRNTLPVILRGTLYFDAPLDPDAGVGGDFHVTFENGIEAASGRTVFSTSFSARVQ